MTDRNRDEQTTIEQLFLNNLVINQLSTLEIAGNFALHFQCDVLSLAGQPDAILIGQLAMNLLVWKEGTRDSKEGHGASSVKMLPAGEIDQTVMTQVRAILASPDVVTQVWRDVCKRKDQATEGMTELQVAAAINRLDRIWDQLFPLEQHRIVGLLVERVIISPNELLVRMHPNGIENLALDVMRNAARKPIAREGVWA